MAFITLEHLRKTAAALLEKIDTKLSKSDIEINETYTMNADGDCIIGTINNETIKVPYYWLADNTYQYDNLTPNSYSNLASLVGTKDKFRWNNMAIGYIYNNTLYVKKPTTRTYSASHYSGLFYFFVPSTGTGATANETNISINKVIFFDEYGVETNYQYDNYTFSEAGLYVGWDSDGFAFYKLPDYKDILIGRIQGSTLIAPSSTFDISGSSYGFYFVVPSSGYGTSGQGTANSTITYVKFRNTSYHIANTTFTKSGLYRGWMNGNNFVYEEVGGSADSPVFTTQITIGNTTMTEAQLSNLLSVASNLTAAAGVSF